MGYKIYDSFSEKKRRGQKAFAVLLDPDKIRPEKLRPLLDLCSECGVDFLLLGGSLVVTDHLDLCVDLIKKDCKIPLILFPGHPTQISRNADALLYLSLISGRNPELLIGQHVISAPAVRQSGLEVIPTGYMVIDGGAPTTVSYISNASPIPSDKEDIAMCTAMAGEMLGSKLIYLDAGSGARVPVTENMIRKVSSNISVPLVVGGGIRDPEKAYRNCRAGADIIVVGNAVEKTPGLIRDLALAVHSEPATVPPV